jgi:hypothetical protein
MCTTSIFQADNSSGVVLANFNDDGHGFAYAKGLRRCRKGRCQCTHFALHPDTPAYSVYSTCSVCLHNENHHDVKPRFDNTKKGFAYYGVTGSALPYASTAAAAAQTPNAWCLPLTFKLNKSMVFTFENKDNIYVTYTPPESLTSSFSFASDASAVDTSKPHTFYIRSPKTLTPEEKRKVCICLYMNS